RAVTLFDDKPQVLPKVHPRSAIFGVHHFFPTKFLITAKVFYHSNAYMLEKLEGVPANFFRRWSVNPSYIFERLIEYQAHIRHFLQPDFAGSMRGEPAKRKIGHCLLLVLFVNVPKLWRNSHVLQLVKYTPTEQDSEVSRQC